MGPHPRTTTLGGAPGRLHPGDIAPRLGSALGTVRRVMNPWPRRSSPPGPRPRTNKLGWIVFFISSILGVACTNVSDIAAPDLTATTTTSVVVRTGTHVVKVFLDDRTNDDGATRETLLASLLDSPGVVDAVYYSKADAFEEALDVFKNNPSVLRVMEENPGLVPASFRFLVSSEAAATELAATAPNTPGVTEARVISCADPDLDPLTGSALEALGCP